jgi:glucose/arabinose dehydrogenase/mono/diheme cytochrome c family protein
MPIRSILIALVSLALAVLVFRWQKASAAAAELRASAARGGPVYAQKCQVCHQANGTGVAGVFPPLAGSDFLVKERERSIKALCEGIAGKITVNGAIYDGQMPAQALDDQSVADVLNYIGTSWGNSLPAFTKKEIAAARGKTGFPTYEMLLASMEFSPLPKAPQGYSVREVARMPDGEFGSRMAVHGGRTWVLSQRGTVLFLDEKAGAFVPVIAPGDYLDTSRGTEALGLMVGADGRMWISSNQRQERAGTFPLSEASIWRTPPLGPDGKPGKPELWFRATYPHGGGFNHGISHLAIGPDGMLYLASGSRTDGGEKTEVHPDAPTGEVETTAALWKFDPAAKEPKMEVIARGIRNPYGFAWDAAGNLFTVANGPNANAPEEMDHIVPGRHYGFPYQFSDWPLVPKPYPHTPDAPAGMEFSKPVKNLGPDGGAGSSTFDPHSCPGGMIWCGEDFPEPLRNAFVVTRFGNLLAESTTRLKDAGFDVLAMKLARGEDGAWTAKTTTVLAPLGRPIDIVQTSPGTVLILEHTRPTNMRDGLGWMPGRVIELKANVQ